ncbi:MAG: CYTH domain-containing protein [Oscillospiraceae bacterium]|nr:CYTH domain-containing protein [Oscillospiraceae bacterium]
MEKEYKWLASEAIRAQFCEMLAKHPFLRGSGILHMAADYYETPDRTLREQGVALRLRRENEKTVCCMKRTLQKTGALAVREEYETEASDLREGLMKLPEAGAPKDICIFLAAQNLTAFAQTAFTRQWFLLDAGAFTAEFAVDAGKLGNSDHMEPFEELEFELKSGDPDAFCAYAERIQAEYALTPQPLSKLARAAAAGRTVSDSTSDTL